MTRRPLTLLAAAAALVACTSNPGVHVRDAQPATIHAAPVEPTEGDGIGDALFPELGNPGIDVQHYDVSIDVNGGTIAGIVGLDVVLTEDRQEITLDSDGPAVLLVTVDGADATFLDDTPELRITLPHAGQAGDSLRVEVKYLVAAPAADSMVGLDAGWFTTAGGSYVLNEPDAARTWMPCNDHPSDKATYTFTISVPIGTTAVANGALTDQHTARDTDVWVWQEDRPMATYLIQLLTGDYQVIESTGPNGVPLVSAVLRDDVATMQPFLDVTPQMMKYFEKFFGAYPLDRYGLAITDSFSGLAMETQERSLFSRLDFEDGQLGQSQQMYLSHELAHQWFGDAVSPAQWSDIWLNESFATYGEWLWADHIGAEGIESRAASELAFRAPGSSTDPSAGDLFGSNSYGGGAVVLHALRHTIGDEAFFELLSRWVAENNGESRVTADFVALAQEVAGTSLTDFFDTWLYADSPPTQFPNG